MMQSISLCDHVTERDVIGQYDLIVERERYHSRNLVTERDASSKLSACAHQLPITNYQLPITNPPHIGYPKVNQDFICLLLGERRYMSPAGSPKNLGFVGVLSMMQSISLCDHVTERGASSKQQQRCSPITIYPSI